MKKWIVSSGRKCCEEHYQNGYKVAWRSAQFELYSRQRPVFELIAVPEGDGKLDSIDIYNCGYDVELIEQSDGWWCEGDFDIESPAESCYLWNFTVEEAAV
jgi:hypothetical protein